MYVYILTIFTFRNTITYFDASASS